MNNQEKQKRLKEKEQIAFMDEVDAALHRRAAHRGAGALARARL